MNVPSTWNEARERVHLFAQRLLAERLVYFTAGNISMRISDDPELVAMTPASTPYDTMRASDVVIVRLDGRVVDGALKPTSELPLHTLTYARRPDVGGIVHTHSAAAMAAAAMSIAIPPILHGLIAACGGGIVTAPYARGGTAEVAELTADSLRDRSACLLRNHGVLAIGPTVDHAYNAASVVEGVADAYLRALAFGPVPEIAPDEVDRIRREQWSPAWSAAVSAPTHGG
ncbi:MAG TPA: class II aldolase/adducin family protein [Candidatus Limnocylindrales bacterium]